jgi:hypothetical protein
VDGVVESLRGIVVVDDIVFAMVSGEDWVG